MPPDTLSPFEAAYLENLDRHWAVAKLHIGGKTMPPIEIQTLPIEHETNEERLEQIRRQTRLRYGKPRREVEQEFGQVHRTPAAFGRVYDIDEE